jgi:hypothetical protein
MSLDFPNLDLDVNVEAFEQAELNEPQSRPPRMQSRPALQYEISVPSSRYEHQEPAQDLFNRENFDGGFGSPRLPSGDNFPRELSSSPDTRLASIALSSDALETRFFPTIKVEGPRQLLLQGFRPQEKQRIQTPETPVTMTSRPLPPWMRAREPEVSSDSPIATRSIAEPIRTSKGASRDTRYRMSASNNTPKGLFTTSNRRFKQNLHLGFRFWSPVLATLALMGVIVSYVYMQRQYRHIKRNYQGNLPCNQSSPLDHQSSIVFSYAFSISRLDDNAPPTATEIISPTLGSPHGSEPTGLGGHQSFLERKDEISTMVRARWIPEIDWVQGTSEGVASPNAHEESSLVEGFEEELIPDNVPNNLASDHVCHVESDSKRMSEEAASERKENSDSAINQDSELGSEGEEVDRDAEAVEVDVEDIEVEAERRRIARLARTRLASSINSIKVN